MRPPAITRYAPRKISQLEKVRSSGARPSSEDVQSTVSGSPRAQPSGNSKPERYLFSSIGPSSISSPPIPRKKSRSALLKQALQYLVPGKEGSSIIRAALAVEAAVTRDLGDVKRFPEVARVAEVRHGLELCREEQDFLTARKEFIRKAFAKYMDVDCASVHPEDVPIVGFGGSGGGLRAMITVLGFCKESQKSSLWDVFTYVAGVSGSCWSLAAYYTFGEANMTKVIEHCKRRFSPYHPLSYRAIRELLKEGAYATLGPLIQKRRSGLNTVMMDLYSVLTTGYLFLHKDPTLIPGGPGHRDAKKEVAGYHREWYKWSSAALQGGKQPLPILTAVRHERPWMWADNGVDMRDSWFQWFEMTPFEIGCDELQAWVPTWGFGRPFSGGKSQTQLPEQSLALLLGLCTSAPAAHLKSYLTTIERNLSRGLIGTIIRQIAKRIAWLWGKQGLRDFQMHHPIHACNEHNFMYQLTGNDASERNAAPPISQFPRLHLIDSGVDNNCPTYVLLHPSRNVDVIITVDASSDVKRETFQARIDQIGSRRKLRFSKRNPLLKPSADADSPDRFKDLYAQVFDGTVLDERPETVVDSYGHVVTNPPAPPSGRDCTMIYVPLLPNENAVKGFDPLTAKFAKSFNLVWTPEQVESLTQVAAANFRAGEATIKSVLRAVWLKKKAKRELQEKNARS